MGKIETLKQNKSLIVMDGAMGTELESHGYDVNDALWSAKFLKENPDAIKEIHKDYLRAGSDIITCASYQATIQGFLKAGYTEAEGEELIRRSLEIAISARNDWWEEEGKDSGRPFPVVAGDIGPYGAYLADGSEYTGSYSLTYEGYRDFHFKRMQILKDAGADIFAVETCPKLEEAIAEAKMLEELEADYWISFTFRSETEISDGTSIDKVCEALKEFPHLKALGVNCTPPEKVNGIIKNYRDLTELPICVYPNSGEIYDGIEKVWNGAPDGRTYIERAEDWLRLGAAWIGGCCRTTPKDIRAVASLSAHGFGSVKIRK